MLRRTSNRVAGPAALVAAAVAGLALAPQGRSAAPLVRWCGSDAVAADRAPDAVAGPQIHVIYAVPAPEKIDLQKIDKITTDLAAGDAWWRGQDPTRAPRYDLYPFPECAGGLAALDVTALQLPRVTTDYSGDRWNRIRLDLEQAGFTNPHKKYLVFYDTVVTTPDVRNGCGEAGGAWAVVYLGSFCGADWGEGGRLAVVALHELLHALDAVPSPGPPHLCPESLHVCDSAADIMFPERDRESSLATSVLDVDRDDYYGHSGSWFDVQDSPWLRRLDAPQYELTVSEPAGGRIASELPGIACPGACRVDWDAGTEVELRAVPAEGKTFIRWEGHCSGSQACTVRMDGARTVGAVFTTLPVASIAALRPVYDLGDPVTLVSTSRDPDGSIARVAWQLGDGRNAVGSPATHVYREPGQYIVEVEVTDNAGGKATASATLRIADLSPPAVTARPQRVQAGARVRLAYRATDNSGNTVRAVAEIFRGSRRVAVFPASPAANGTEGAAHWRTVRPGDLRWCVRAWDAAGNVSRPACAALRVRAR